MYRHKKARWKWAPVDHLHTLHMFFTWSPNRKRTPGKEHAGHKHSAIIISEVTLQVLNKQHTHTQWSSAFTKNKNKQGTDWSKKGNKHLNIESNSKWVAIGYNDLENLYSFGGYTGDVSFSLAPPPPPSIPSLSFFTITTDIEDFRSTALNSVI